MEQSPPSPPCRASSEAACGPMEAAALAGRYRRLMRLGVAAFVALAALIVTTAFFRQREAEILLSRQRVRETVLHVRALIGAASNHVARLTAWAEEFPSHLPYQGAADLRRTALDGLAAAGGGEFSLDALPKVPGRHRLGQIVGRAEAIRPRLGAGGGASDLDLALSLLDHFANGREPGSFPRWTYFVSADKNLLAISPFTRSAELLNGAPDVATFLDVMWTLELCVAAFPENNPGRKPYWTRAYLDQAGAGLMVSRAAPVYWGSELVGVMAADVPLSFLSEVLREFPDPDGVLAIANEHGQLLADRAGVAAGGSQVRMLGDVLPEDAASLVGRTPRSLDGARTVGGSLVIAETLPDPAWTLVFVLPRTTLAERAIERFAPPLLIAVLIAAALVVMQRYLWRMFAAPALSIADFVASEADDAKARMLELPARWRPWAEALARAFAERREYLAELKATNEMLEERVEERTKDLAEANERLTALAVTDPLTGAFNRRRLFEMLEAERARVARGEPPMSLLMMDIDFFKKINDTFGHAAGDAVLRQMVARCRAALRTTDAVFRYGGEEFVALLPLTPIGGATILAERLRESVAAAPMSHEGVPIPVTVSIGAAQYRPEESVEDTLARADRGLYAAKEGGRNRVMVVE